MKVNGTLGTVCNEDSASALVAFKNKKKKTNCQDDSDVGDIVMLVTLSWLRFVDVGDRISMLVTSFECWCPTLMERDSGCW